jgi:hypothetical protein
VIEADEGAHLTLEGGPDFQSLPHPLAQRPISPAVEQALAAYGVAAGATTFDAAEALAQCHPLLNRNGEKAAGAGNPQERYLQLLALHQAGEQELLARGLDDAHAWLRSPIAEGFGRRLTSLGWIGDDARTPCCFRLRAVQK